MGTRPSLICSGERYAGVPMTSPVAVKDGPDELAVRSTANPKSKSMGSPEGVTIMLPGLMSR